MHGNGALSELYLARRLIKKSSFAPAKHSSSYSFFLMSVNCVSYVRDMLTVPKNCAFYAIASSVIVALYSYFCDYATRDYYPVWTGVGMKLVR